MEKIYEENGKKKQSFFQQFFNNKGSMIAVIVVAIVAIVGLVAFGFNQISFAADEDVGGMGGAGLGDTFTSASYTKMVNGETSTPGTNVGFYPFMAANEDGLDIFITCIERMINYTPGKEYTKSDAVTDPGLIYLVNTLKNKMADEENLLTSWITQAAVWTYLYEYETEESLAKDAALATNYKNVYEYADEVHSLYTGSSDTDPIVYLYRAKTGSFWNDFGIAEIITEARKLRNSGSIRYSIKLDRENDKFSMSQDGKDYISSLYSITSTNADSLSRYFIDLTDAPEGIGLCKANGEKIDPVGDRQFYIDPATKFRLVIPVDKVTDATKNFDISVSTNFIGLVKYTSTGYQTVVGENIIFLNDKIGVEINYTPNVPNTGMTTAQTIYFIGLIILLGGVGIIYANAKPQENN